MLCSGGNFNFVFKIEARLTWRAWGKPERTEGKWLMWRGHLSCTLNPLHCTRDWFCHLERGLLCFLWRRWISRKEVAWVQRVCVSSRASPCSPSKNGQGMHIYLVFIHTHICVCRHRPDPHTDILLYACWETRYIRRPFYVPALGFSLPTVTQNLKQTTIYWVVFRNMSVVTTAALISINTH